MNLKNQLGELDVLLQNLVQERREKLNQFEDEELEDVTSHEQRNDLCSAPSEEHRQESVTRKSQSKEGELRNVVDSDSDSEDESEGETLRQDAPILWQASDRLELATRLPHEMLTEEQILDQEEYDFAIDTKRAALVDALESQGVKSSPYGTAWYISPRKWNEAAKTKPGASLEGLPGRRDLP
ncbi:Hypothetical Protein FCC1311_044582 [Hondaea fermentalgiana]|uniref:Uncharacterized protein n=1 Tax=Hondaea fermentalgiana TaxID=2315210 RepID=A0A2R5GCF2_9STRA|nr:Hypothetical Protein FCC1311_044582 [Hondaea fermentalgiana]|eukprot:GBG28235.1 Hypothetical Protein FCC1311_044582 [Hondaea fermentalgiana]